MEGDAVAMPEGTLRPRSHPSEQRESPRPVSRHSRSKGLKDDQYEDTPLLARNIDEFEAPSDGAEGSDEPAPTWSGEKDFEGRPWWNQPSIFWVLPVFLLYTLAFGGIIVPKINLILDLICNEYMCSTAAKDPNFRFLPLSLGIGNETCRHIDEVQKRVARFTLLTGLIAGLLSAITSPGLGELSDRYGRRKIIAFAALGSMMSELITILAVKYPKMISVKWLLLGSAMDGLCGSFTAGMAITYAYASDCTAPSKRAVAFGYFHVCLFGGIALGPLISGFIVKVTGNTLIIFYISLACHAIYSLWIAFVIPESLTKARQMQARQRRQEKRDSVDSTDAKESFLFSRALRITNIFAPLAILWPTDPGTSRHVRRNIALLAAIDTIMFGVAMGSMNVIMLYAEYSFNWGTPETSLFVSMCNFSRVTVLLGILPLIVRVVRGPASKALVAESGSDLLDLSIIRLAVAFDMLGYIGYAVVRMGSLFTVSGMLAAVGAMGSPTIASALTKHIPPERTGQMLGAMGLLHALARVVSPVIFSLIYSLTVGKFTQTVFVCLAATWGLAFILSWFLKPHVYWDEKEATEGPSA